MIFNKKKNKSNQIFREKILIKITKLITLICSIKLNKKNKTKKRIFLLILNNVINQHKTETQLIMHKIIKLSYLTIFKMERMKTVH